MCIALTGNHLMPLLMSNPRRRLIIQTIAATLAVLAISGSFIGYALMMSGVYNVSSTSQHLQFVYTFLEKGMHQSVRFHARDIVSPQQLNEPKLITAGAQLYKAHCVECHGAPGVAPSGIGMSMQPVPGPLVDATSKWQPNELYWIVRHGIKMSGMPAWEYRISDDEIWQTVAFLQQMPNLSPADYKAMTHDKVKP
jgi:mono/diheme cytochrome c family protein